MKETNAFDLLRLILAALVIISHSILIGGYNLIDPLSAFSKNQTSFADFGVMGFFALSGYLITSSFNTTRNLPIFMNHRLLRILPGYWTCLFITAFVFAPIIFFLAQQSFAEFNLIGSSGAVQFFLNNFFIKINQWNISAVLDLAAYQGSLNGSLWSLFPEILCYLFTAIAGWFGLFNKNKIIFLLITLTTLTFFAGNFVYTNKAGPSLFTLSPAFILYASYLSGSLIFVYHEWLLFDKKGTIFLILFTAFLLKFGGYNLISPLLVSLTLINTFRSFKFKLKYDVSYGVYIYSFPVQHVLFGSFGSTIPLPTFILLTLLITGLLGLFSYVLIEKPIIKSRGVLDTKINKIITSAKLNFAKIKFHQRLDQKQKQPSDPV